MQGFDEQVHRGFREDEPGYCFCNQELGPVSYTHLDVYKRQVTHAQHDSGYAGRTINLFDGQVVNEI